jgi:hypothetical protein
MTAKEKAEKLVNSFIGLNSKKMSDYSRIEYPTAKECALIAVDEILKVAFYSTDEIYNFYIEVKQEIERL